jgi:hypothetical protein
MPALSRLTISWISGEDGLLEGCFSEHWFISCVLCISWFTFCLTSNAGEAEGYVVQGARSYCAACAPQPQLWPQKDAKITEMEAAAFVFLAIFGGQVFARRIKTCVSLVRLARRPFHIQRCLLSAFPHLSVSAISW